MHPHTDTTPRATPSPTSGAPASLEGTLADLAAASAAEHHCPSIAWAVVEDGRITISGSTGALEDGSAPTTRTVYRIASMTKSFTAATVLALRDEGAVRLDDPVDHHAPELRSITAPTSDAPPITLGDLLSMSAGFATDDVWADRHLDMSDAELDAIIADGVHFAVDPRTSFEYSNLGFALVGRIVERATGTRVQEHVRTRFLEPLGMTRTAWVGPDDDDWARPHRWAEGAHAPEVLVGDGVLAPMGGIWSCLDDLAIWTSWFAEAFPARDDDEEGPLRRASRREMQQIHRYAGTREIAGHPAPQGYGYGLLLRDDPVAGPLAGHSGGLPGYGSNMRWTLGGRRRAAIALADVTYGPMAELTLRMLHAMAAAGRLPPVHVPVSNSLRDAAERLVAVLNEWDDERADDLFTDNVALDEPYDRRRRHAAELLAGGGPVLLQEVTAVSRARADLVVAQASGEAFKVEFEVAPLVPVRIESFSIERA